MNGHATEAGISIGGFLATASFDIAGAPHWLTLAVGATTLVYTVLKTWIAAIELKHKRRERNKNEL